jgi:hypothetical protein
MSMTDQHGINMSQPILWEPLDSSRLKILAHINDNGPELPSPSCRARRRAGERTSSSRLFLQCA